MRELHLLLLRNFIEIVPLRGIKGSMISTFLHHCHYFWTHESGLQYRVSGQQEFPREFPSLQGDSPKILVSALSLSNLNGFALFFFENAHKNIPDITVSLEYFILAGERSYIDRRHVGMPKHQFSCLASNNP
jgi:hypothetical protein